MNAEEMWRASGLQGSYEAWAFGEAQDKLAELTRRGVKTATSSAYAPYAASGERLPEVGDNSVILDAKGDAVCIIRTTRVVVTPYGQVPDEFAYKEGEGDRSLAYWREVHEEFFTGELAALGVAFDEETLVVCEEFEVVYGELG